MCLDALVAGAKVAFSCVFGPILCICQDQRQIIGGSGDGSLGFDEDFLFAGKKQRSFQIAALHRTHRDGR